MVSEGERPGRSVQEDLAGAHRSRQAGDPAARLEVPGADCLLSKEQLRSIYESSLSGNFRRPRLLENRFPELFTHENLRKQYNCSGSLGKKQLDPSRIKSSAYYVQLLYPRASNDLCLDTGVRKQTRRGACRAGTRSRGALTSSSARSTFRALSAGTWPAMQSTRAIPGGI